MTDTTTTPDTIAYLHKVRSILASHDYSPRLDMLEVELLLGNHCSAIDAFNCATEIMADRAFVDEMNRNA